MNAFRNLYKVWSNGKVVAFLTADNHVHAADKYKAFGGQAESHTIQLEQMTFGYPHVVCSIYY